MTSERLETLPPSVLGWAVRGVISALMVVCGYFATQTLQDIRDSQHASLSAQEAMGTRLAHIETLVDVSGRRGDENTRQIDVLRGDVGTLKQRVSVLETWRQGSDDIRAPGRNDR